MGKVTVEKLLVSCPKLEKLHLIIREKKGQTMDERFDALFKEPVSSKLRPALTEKFPGFLITGIGNRTLREEIGVKKL